MSSGQYEKILQEIAKEIEMEKMTIDRQQLDYLIAELSQLPSLSRAVKRRILDINETSLKSIEIINPKSEAADLISILNECLQHVSDEFNKLFDEAESQRNN